MNKKILILSIALTLSFSIFAKNNSFDQDIQAIIDSYLANTGKQERVTAVAVTLSFPQDHKMVKRNYFAGKTSVKKNAKPIDKGTLFEIGSITKSYTTALILQLEAEGDLNIDDPIGKWLPQYPMWKDVSVKQLLNMTSGIPNYTTNPRFLDYLSKHLNAEYSDKLLLSYANPKKPISPGQKFDYSNTNYILAGLIIEKITKQNYAKVLESRIIKPLGLKNTYYGGGPNWSKVNALVYPRKAHGYSYDQDDKKLLDLTRYNLSSGGPTGGIISNTIDQLKWINALYSGKIFPKKAHAKLLSELMSFVSIKTGHAIEQVDKDDPMGFGLGIIRLFERGKRFWAYKGSTIGYRVFYLRQTPTNATVVVALNSQGGEKEQIKELALDIYQKMDEKML